MAESRERLRTDSISVKCHARHRFRASAVSNYSFIVIPKSRPPKQIETVALGLRHREVGLAPRQPLRQRGGRVDEQGARARAGARPGLRVGGPVEGGAVRLSEPARQLQAPLDARLHDAGRFQGGGPDSLIALSKRVLPHQLSSAGTRDASALFTQSDMLPASQPSPQTISA